VTNALALTVAFAIGVGAALQTAMLGALGRTRGGTEAAWVSLLASILALALIFAVRSARGDTPALPTPFDRLPVQLALVAVAATLLALSIRGVAPYFAITGLFGVAFLVGAAYLVPSLGVALFFAAVTAGTVMGALAFDHLGAFGAEPQRVTVARAIGLAMLLAGVVIVRS
jgi:uncharacterized membrane protein YdcZ (DUF606 family)